MNQRQFIDYGTLWLDPDLISLNGYIGDKAFKVNIHPVTNRQSDNSPHFRIFRRDGRIEIGVLWFRTAQSSGVQFLSGYVDKGNGKEDLTLWPVKERKKDSSPHYRVLPPKSTEAMAGITSQDTEFSDPLPF